MGRVCTLIMMMSFIAGCSLDIIISQSTESVEVVLSSTAPQNNNLSAIPVTVSLSRHVENLTADSFVVSNATISDFSGIGKSYSLNLIPNSDGVVSIMSPPTELSVVAKAKTLVSNVLSFNVDRDQLAVSVIGPEPAMGTTATNYVWTVTYTGESSISLSSADILLGGTVGACTEKTVAGSGSVRTVTVGGCSAPGKLTMALAANTAEDSDGNFVSEMQGTGQAEIIEPIEVSLAQTYDVLPRSLGAETQGFGVRLSQAIPVDVQVHYAVVSAFTTASAGQFSLPQRGYIVIPADHQTGWINYQFYGSVLPVGSEIIQLSLTGVTGAGGAAYIGKQISRRLIFDRSLNAQAEAVSVGTDSSCAIYSGGQLRCWGDNTYGQLGNGTIETSSSPQAVSGGGQFTSISIWDYHVCGIVTGGELRCWGRNQYGQVGNNSLVDQLTPTVIDSGVSYTAVSAGADHTCGLITGGSIKCWGRNTAGQLGDSTTDSSLVPVLVDDPGTVYKSISVGDHRSCGITEDDVLKCWGSNGNLGTGDSSLALSPVVIDAGVTYKQIKVGQIICGITTSSRVKCWGANFNGQVGDGSTANTNIPVMVADTDLYQDVSVGRTMNCGRTEDDVLKCWGSGLYDGRQYQYEVPTVVEASKVYSTISVNGSSYCGISEGVLLCWGKNRKGQLGNSHISNRFLAPTRTKNDNANQIDLSLSNGCTLDHQGVMSCWGNNSYGQLGDWSQFGKSAPVLIDPGVAYKSLAIGPAHSCALTKSNTLKCWGNNSDGQLGLGHSIGVFFPTEVDRTTKYLIVSTGLEHTCAITALGKLQCWGRNQYGQVGDGSTASRSSPVDIDGGNTYKYVSAGQRQSCAITTTGQMRCWGGAGVGDGSSSDVHSPVDVDAGESYQSVSVAEAGSMICGITEGGVLKCWGSGTIGTGIAGPQLTPIEVDSGTLYKKVVVNYSKSCGLTTENRVKCWGYLYGTAAFESSEVPVVMDPSESYKDVSGNYLVSCAISISGLQKCWGDFDTTEIDIFGLGEMANFPSPIRPIN